MIDFHNLRGHLTLSSRPGSGGNTPCQTCLESFQFGLSVKVDLCFLYEYCVSTRSESNIWKFLEISEVIIITLIVQVLIINFGLDFRDFLQKLLFISEQAGIFTSARPELMISG